MSCIRYVAGAVVLGLLSSVVHAAENDTVAVSLFSVADLVCTGNKSRTADSLSIAGLNAVRRQSLAPVNPEVEAGITRGIADGEENRWSLSLSQKIGPSRSAGSISARALLAGETARYRESVADLRSLSLSAGLNVWAAQEAVIRAREAAADAAVIESLTVLRVRAGRDAESLLLRARADRATASVELLRAESRLTYAHGECRVLWGSAGPTTFSIVLEDGIENMPSTDSLLRAVKDGPLLMRSRAAVDAARAEHSAQRLRTVPDITITGGVEGRAGGEVAGVAGSVAIEVPIFQRNRGGRVAAECAERGAALRYAEEQSRADQRLAALAKELDAMRQMRVVAEQEIVPAAEAFYASTRSAFSAGRADWRDLSDAKMNLRLAQESRVAAVVDHLNVTFEIERLCAVSPVQSSRGKE